MSALLSSRQLYNLLTCFCTVRITNLNKPVCRRNKFLEANNLRFIPFPDVRIHNFMLNLQKRNWESIEKKIICTIWSHSGDRISDSFPDFPSVSKTFHRESSLHLVQSLSELFEQHLIQFNKGINVKIWLPI